MRENLKPMLAPGVQLCSVDYYEETDRGVRLKAGLNLYKVLQWNEIFFGD